MNVAIFIPPRDFRDETVSKAKLLMEKWNVKPVIVSYSTKDCVGYHGAVYKTDQNAAKVDAKEFDAILLVDGVGIEDYKLYDFRPLLELIKSFKNNGKIIAAIGNAVKIVTRSNIITDVQIAAPVDEETKRYIRIYRGNESESDVEFDKNILTAKNSDNVDSFIDTLLDKLGAK